MSHLHVPMFRIYKSTKPHLHLGNVEADNVEVALDKAVKGNWFRYWAKPEDQPTSTEGLVAHQ